MTDHWAIRKKVSRRKFSIMRNVLFAALCVAAGPAFADEFIAPVPPNIPPNTCDQKTLLKFSKETEDGYTKWAKDNSEAANSPEAVGRTTAGYDFINGYRAGWNITSGSHDFLVGSYAGSDITNQSYIVEYAGKFRCDLLRHVCICYGVPVS